MLQKGLISYVAAKIIITAISNFKNVQILKKMISQNYSFTGKSPIRVNPGNVLNKSQIQ